MKNNPGPRLVATTDDSFAVIEKDGSTSVKINMALKDGNDPYRIRYWTSSQEIYDESGKTVARTSDPQMAKHICHLLIAFVNIQKRKAASGSLPDAQQDQK
jgi:hypothetical protein